MLTHKEIASLAKSGVQKQHPDGTPNLYLHTRTSCAANWLCRTTIDGKRVLITIGAWPVISAPKARAITPRIVDLIKEGHGVQAVRNAISTTIEPDAMVALVKGQKVAVDRPTPTFEEIGREWYNTHLKDGLSEGPYKRQVLQQLEDHVFPALGRRPINEIKRKEITDAIRTIWVEKHPTGIKVRGNIERIFDYAIDLELRDDNPTPPPRSLPLQQHQIEHFSSLPYERVNEFWVWLNNRPRMSIQTQVGIALAVLLGKRTGEIRKMMWAHVDLDAAVWTTPSLDMKKRKSHRQPLPAQAITMLRVLKDASDGTGYVLANADGKPMSENTMLYALKTFDDITTHGFRATLGSWCTDNGVDKRVSDFIKSHQPKYLDAAYSRTDMLEERRKVLQRWADFVIGTGRA